MAPPGGGGSGGGGGGGGLNPDIIRSLTELLGSSNTNLERMLENLGRLGASSQSLTGLAGSAQELADHLGGLGRSLTDLQKLLGKVNNESKKQSSILKGLGSSWKVFAAAAKGAMGILGGLTDVISTVGGALWDLGAAIIAVPFDMLNWLVKKSKEVLRGGTEIADAYERIREQFGDLTKSTAKDVIDFGKSMATGMITPTLSARRVFGSLAEAMDQALEVAAEAPATFQLLSDQFEENGLQIMAMAKGLGIGKEELTALQQRAVATGTSLVDLESEITKYAKGMSAQFGLNSKAMSRDMGRAMKDVKHFANSTIKEIAQATTYAHKLGLELKDITGVLDKFNTFDEAAENVSKLSQAFGINVDAMKLVEAKTPAEALDMLKQAMNAAGKSADQMNRHELQLLASTVGMSEEQVRMAFSMKNSGVSMDKVKQAGTGLEHQMMNTAEAIAAVADDIKRMNKAGQEVKGESFFEIFGEGFLMGIDTSKEFLSLLMAVKKDIYIVRDAGIQLGRAFVANFPGVKDFIDGLKQMLNPTAIKGLMSNVVNIFKDFFDQLKQGTADTGKLFDSLVNGFTNFAEKTSGGSQMLKGLKNIWRAVERIISTGVDWLASKLASGLNAIFEAMSNGGLVKFAAKVPGAVGDALSSGASAVIESPISKSLIAGLGKIAEPLEKIFDKLWKRIVDKLGKFIQEYKWEIAFFAFGPAVFNMFSSGITSALSNPAILSKFASLGPLLANPITLAVGAGVAVIGAAAYQINKDLENAERERKLNAEATLNAEKQKNETFVRQNATLEEQIKKLRERAKLGDEEAGRQAARLSKEQENDRQIRLGTQARALGAKFADIEKEADATFNINEEKLEEMFKDAGAQLQANLTSGVKGAAATSEKEISGAVNRLFMLGQKGGFGGEGGQLQNVAKDLQQRIEEGSIDLDAIVNMSIDKLETSENAAIQALLGGEGRSTYDLKDIDLTSTEAAYIKAIAMQQKAKAQALAEAKKEGETIFEERLKELDIGPEFTSEKLKNLLDPKTNEKITLDYLETLKKSGGADAVKAALASALTVVPDKADLEPALAEAEKKKADDIKAAKEDALKELGLDSDFSVKNAEEAIGKVEDLAKRMTGKSLEDLKKSLDDIRAAFKGIDFTILPPGESDKLMGSVLDMTSVNKLMVSIADAADNMANIPKAASKLTQLPNDAKTYSDSIDKVRSFLFGDFNKEGVSKGILWSMSDIGTDAGIYATKLNTTKDTLGSISSSVEAITGQIEKIMNALPKLQRGGGLPRAFAVIDSVAAASLELKGGYDSEATIKSLVTSAMTAATTSMTQVAPGMKALVDASTTLSKTLTDNVVRSVDATANRIDQLFISLEKITNAIARPIGAKSPQELGSKVKAMVDAINQLNAAMTDIKIGENGEVNVKMNNLAKGINKADQKYTIEKKNAVINLTVSVSMSVTDVESMLIKNPNSLIRARINDALSSDKKEINAGGTGTVDVGT